MDKVPLGGSQSLVFGMNAPGFSLGGECPRCRRLYPPERNQSPAGGQEAARSVLFAIPSPKGMRGQCAQPRLPLAEDGPLDPSADAPAPLDDPDDDFPPELLDEVAKPINAVRTAWSMADLTELDDIPFIT